MEAMERDAVLRRCPLFRQMDAQEIRQVLSCLDAREESFSRGTFLFHPGCRMETVGLMLSGEIHLVKEDFWGNRSLVARIGPGGLLGEAYACLPQQTLTVGVLASADSRVLFFQAGKVFSPCQSACAFHQRLIRNLAAVLAEKNRMLLEKMEHLTQRSTREKLLSYLSAESQRQGRAAFTLPFNRQQLADYLSVDRSALSAELGKLRDEGILTFHKSDFTLL